MRRKLWLILFPFLFLPNMGVSQATMFGELESSDYLIMPFLFCVVLALQPNKVQTLRKSLYALMGMFLFWATISTLSIAFRYDYASVIPILNSLIKLAKFTVYSSLGLLVSFLITNNKTYKQFNLVMPIALIIIGGALLVYEGIHRPDIGGPVQGYKVTNAVSVLGSILLCYICALFSISASKRTDIHEFLATFRWRFIGLSSIIIGTMGLLVSGGRGGWVGAMVGLLLIAYRQGIKLRFIISLGVIFGIAFFTYNTNDNFKGEIDQTLRLNDYEGYHHVAETKTVDDGARLYSWSNEIKKLPDAAILGTGFFHRGGQTLLWATGSHNFLIQMFLETGLVGGLLLLLIMFRMWRHSYYVQKYSLGLGLPTEAALIAGFCGVMGGEYFYGGMVIFTFIVVYAPVGAVPRRHLSDIGLRSNK